MGLLRSVLLRASQSSWLERQFRRRGFARRAVSRFMPGEDGEAALAAAGELQRNGLGSLFTLLGENVTRREEVEEVTAHYVTMLERIEDEGLPGQLSVKPTQLGLDLSPALARDQLLRLVESAEPRNIPVWVDMEASSYVDATLELYGIARASHANVGVCLQAYLYRTPRDLETVREMDGAVRLVKGAYQEPADVAYPKKADVDRAFRDLALELLGWSPGPGVPPPVLGTHDTALVETIRREAPSEVPAGNGDSGRRPWEVHMLYGIAPGEQRRLNASGIPVKVLISYGEKWYPWYVRRLAERPANLAFLARSMLRA